MRPISESPFSTRSLLIVVATLMAGAVMTTSATAEPAPLRATEPAAKAMPTPKAAAPAAEMTRGKVLETMDAATYTYARVETPAGEKWIAGPRTAIKVGDLLAWPGGAEMKNFPSKTLGRTFESILFVDQLIVGGASAAPGKSAPHGTLSSKAPEGPEIKDIKKAEGGQTIGEIYDRRAELEGKEVLLRGKVVKYNSGVMDRNWLHVQDGSHGGAGDNDLTVTSEGQAAVGDTVLVRGKLVLNKDFGYGYRYDVLVEGATVAIED